MQIVSSGDNLHEISISLFSGKNKKKMMNFLSIDVKVNASVMIYFRGQ